MSQSNPPSSLILKKRKSSPAARGAARRSEILAVAEIVFLEHGFEKTSVDDIAARAGASKATMYKYFGNKEGLFSEVLHEIVPDIPGNLVKELDGDKSFRDMLLDWSLQIIDMVTAPRPISMYRLIVTEATRNSRMNVIHYESGPRATHKELVAFLREATNRGHIHCDVPESMARLFAAAAFGEPFEHAVLALPARSRDEIASDLKLIIAMLESHCPPRQKG